MFTSIAQGLLFISEFETSLLNINKKRTKNSLLNMTYFLLMAQVLVSYCELLQVQWNKNNNAIKTKFTPTALNVI